MYEVYHLEFLAPDAKVLRRVLVHARSVQAAKERALSAFRRARRPQAHGPDIDMVKLIDGAGYEVFSVGARD
jgi:hypothetical protein